MDIDARYVIAALQDELTRVNENRLYLLALVKQLTDVPPVVDSEPEQPSDVDLP